MMIIDRGLLFGPPCTYVYDYDTVNPTFVLGLYGVFRNWIS